MNRFAIKVLFVLGAACVVAAPFAATATQHVVSMLSLSFSPSSLMVVVGDSVTWVNKSAFIHTTTSGTPCTANGMWDSGNMNPGAEFSFRFNSEGTFAYYCIPHCLAGMTGAITVEPGLPVQNRTWGSIKALFKVSLAPDRFFPPACNLAG